MLLCFQLLVIDYFNIFAKSLLKSYRIEKNLNYVFRKHSNCLLVMFLAQHNY